MFYYIRIPNIIFYHSQKKGVLMIRRKIKFNSKEEWLNLRRAYVGASEISILNKTNHFSNPLDLYNKKIFGVEAEENERMRWGNILEDAIAREWAERNGRKVRKSNFLYVADFALAQMLCLGVTEGVYVALINNGQLYDVNVELDFEYAKGLLKLAKEFIENHIRKNIPPELPTEEPQEITEESMEGSEEDFQKFERIKTLELAIKQLNDEKTAIVDSIKQKIGNKKELIYAGRKLFYYNQYYQFNSQQFKKENPELYETYKNQLVIKFNIGKE